MFVLLSVVGCAWLMEVPDDQRPTRRIEAPKNSGNRVANQVEASDFADPKMRPKLQKLPEGKAGHDASGEWNPVSRPIVVDENASKPFEFKTASGKKIEIKRGPSRSGGKDPEIAEFAEQIGVDYKDAEEMYKDEYEPGK